MATIELDMLALGHRPECDETFGCDEKCTAPAHPETCVMCERTILTMCFKGTGVCGENCRKLRDNQLVIEEVAIGAA